MNTSQKKWAQITFLVGLAVILGYLLSDIYHNRYELKSKVEFFKSTKKTKTSISEKEILGRILCPSEYRISIFASGLKGARFMKVTEKGDVLLSIPSSGRIMLLEKDSNGDGKADGAQELLSGLNKPHGIDVWGKYLYVAETDSVGRIDFDPVGRKVFGEYKRLITGIPTGGHWTRTLRFGPDGRMYLSIGSSCNVCIEKDQRRAAIVRYDEDGSKEMIFASGLRNTVGFDWNQADGQIYGTDNGRDRLGDDFPPCELNLIRENGFYGWPYANGDNIADPDFGKNNEKRIAESIKPVHKFRAHNAPLGITFLKSVSTPDKYRNSALVALHGSWDRSRKDGYKIVSLKWEEDGSVTEQDFLTGFLRTSDDNVAGRPVDVVEDDYGNLYVSDDYAGLVYMMRPVGKEIIKSTSTIYSEKLWETHSCASCHGAEKNTDGIVTRPLAELSKKYSKEKLSAFLKTPTPPMPDNSMTDSELEIMAGYLMVKYP